LCVDGRNEVVFLNGRGDGIYVNLYNVIMCTNGDNSSVAVQIIF